MTAAGSLPPGYVLHAFDRLPSTNVEARRRAEAGAPAGTVVIAAEQTAGRGRHGRKWHSPPGNLYASLILRPACPVAATAELSLVASLALAEAIAALGIAEVGLKWPNDVMIGPAKTAGLLLEGAADAGGRSTWVVVGSGVNLVHAPSTRGYPTTSLAAAGAGEMAPLALLRGYLKRLDGWLDAWHAEGFAAVRGAWLARSYVRPGREVRLRLARGEVRGRFADLSDRGALLLEENGRRREVTTGDLFALGT